MCPITFCSIRQKKTQFVYILPKGAAPLANYVAQQRKDAKRAVYPCALCYHQQDGRPKPPREARQQPRRSGKNPAGARQRRNRRAAARQAPPRRAAVARSEPQRAESRTGPKAAQRPERERKRARPRPTAEAKRKQGGQGEPGGRPERGGEPKAKAARTPRSGQSPADEREGAERARERLSGGRAAKRSEAARRRRREQKRATEGKPHGGSPPRGAGSEPARMAAKHHLSPGGACEKPRARDRQTAGGRAACGESPGSGRPNIYAHTHNRRERASAHVREPRRYPRSKARASKARA